MKNTLIFSASSDLYSVQQFFLSFFIFINFSSLVARVLGYMPSISANLTQITYFHVMCAISSSNSS